MGVCNGIRCRVCFGVLFGGCFFSSPRYNIHYTFYTGMGKMNSTENVLKRAKKIIYRAPLLSFMFGVAIGQIAFNGVNTPIFVVLLGMVLVVLAQKAVIGHAYHLAVVTSFFYGAQCQKDSRDPVNGSIFDLLKGAEHATE